MKELKEFYRNNETQQDVLKNTTDLLRTCFNIDDFWYRTLNEGGHLSGGCSNLDAFYHFWDNECYKGIPYFVSPENLKSGAFLLDDDPEYKRYQDYVEPDYPVYNPLLIIRKNSQGTASLFGFQSRRHIPGFSSYYINHLPLLNGLIDHFVASNQKTLIKSEDSGINIAKLKGNDLFYGKSYGERFLPSTNTAYDYLRKIGAPPILLNYAKKLTPREKEIINSIIEGKAALQIANELNLSRRTVEFYIRNVKNKLGIFSKVELIECGRLLKLAGLLSY